MDRDKYDVGFVFLGKTCPLLYEYFEERGHFVEFIEFGGKRDLLKAIWKLRRIFRQWKPNIVHTHLVEGSLAGLTAAVLAGISRRVHTRHHGVEAHVYYPHGVWYDRYNNWLSRRIVAISPVVAKALIERDKAPSKKVVTIAHGFHLENLIPDPEVTAELRVKYGLESKYPVIGSISRYIHWKGVHHTIAAFSKVLADYPNAKLVLANATGPYSAEIRDLLASTLPKNSYVEISFEPKVTSLYPIFDVFVHVPVDTDLEAFGMVYIEPLAIQVPSVFTLSGIASDFVVDRENAMVVPFNDPNAIAKAVAAVLEDEGLRQALAVKGKEDVWRLFHADRLALEFDTLYTGL